MRRRCVMYSINVKHQAEKSNGALKTHGRSQSGPGPESLTSLVHNENPLQSLASGGIFMCSGDITPFSFESTRQWCVTHRSCPFWLSSLTHLLHHRLPLMSTNSHQHQGALRRGDAHTHTHNSQFLFHCLCNGWVEWAGPGWASRRGPPRASTSLGSDYYGCIPSPRLDLLHSE